MPENKQTYLEKKLQARIVKEPEFIIYFQKEKIKLDSELEIEMLKSLDSHITREIHSNEDEISLRILPDASLSPFSRLKEKDERARWLFAHQLVKKYQEHSLSRMHPAVCPENIYIDNSLHPYFLHYGVKESLPPYERDRETEWHELKATCAQAVDFQHSFSQYLHHSNTLKLAPSAKEIMEAEDEASLLKLIRNHLMKLETEEKSLVRITRKRWWTILAAAAALFVLLVPALIYSINTMFFYKPKQDAYMAAHQAFIDENYTAVKELLGKYKTEEITQPLVKYELAVSSVKTLKENNVGPEQKKNILDKLELAPKANLLDYWINIGRGSGDKALEYAKIYPNDDALMITALFTYQEQLRSKNNLSDDEKKKFTEISSELDQKLNERKQKLKEEKQQEADAAEADAEKTQSQAAPAAGTAQNPPAAKPAAKPASKPAAKPAADQKKDKSQPASSDKK
ncbi:type VII secretion protein EssB [Metabacillus sp. GX 13764]|uniref:type VII secretion protein EssB n=1 Tax=Metabacillus kandeliae TaxID=2900151 RepID=UPI001E5C7E97|nr:type VII secretion protein EssB [Metabacillus kandeliae]MCD7033988.1 type VII secretion protein EssB [Metabacillus kandeliae]